MPLLLLLLHFNSLTRIRVWRGTRIRVWREARVQIQIKCIWFYFYFIFVFTVEILKSGVSVSTCVCVRARVCVRLCVWTCQFRVELLSKTHTSNKSNVTTGRNGTATHLLLPPLFAVVADDDELSLAQYVLCVCDCVCVCIVQAASLLRSTAANFQGRVLLPPLPLSATASASFCWHTRTTHTPPQQLCTSLCVSWLYVCVRLLI